MAAENKIDCVINGVPYKCRTCFDPGRTTHSLTEEASDAKTWREVLNAVAQLQTNDDESLPKTLCCKCLEKLKNSYDFVLQIQDVNKKYRQLLTKCDGVSNEVDNFTDVLGKSAISVPLEKYMPEIKLEKETVVSYDIEISNNKLSEDDEIKYENEDTDDPFTEIYDEDHKSTSEQLEENESQEEDLFKLLEKWNFGYILDKLKSEAITLERLRFLTDSDVDAIFQGFKIGEKSEFRFRLFEWKKDKSHDKIKKRDIDSPSTNQSGYSKKLRYEKIEKFIPSGSYNLHSILHAHPTGNYVEQTFSEIKKLNDASRKILVDAIIAWAIKNKIKFTKQIFEKISSQIEKDFCEDKEIYFRKIGSRSSGRLFDKYYNTVKRLKKTGEWACSNITALDRTLEDESFSNNCKNETEVLKAYEWLKVCNKPWSEVKKNWRVCYSKRRDDILHADGGSNIINVLNKWKLFSHPFGYTLVDIDFGILYPKSTTVFEKWKSFKSKIIPILNSRIKDAGNLEYLKKINASEKGSEQLIVLLLHVILRPSIKRKLSNVMYRSTIKDSQLSFLLHVATLNDVEKRLEQLQTSLYKRGETLQPLIIAVGLNISDATFYVYYNEIKYELPSFFTGLDACFKIFHVLNLKYPRDSIEVWTFIQRYFYSIKLAKDQISPNILCLINDLK